MTLSKKILAAVALVAMASSAAVAQTDFGSPLGAGAGMGGAVAPLGHPGGGGGAGLPGAGGSGLANARANFMNAGAGGVSIPNPAGGNVSLSQDVARALGAVMGGNPTGAQISAATAAIGGSGAAALVQALAALGRGPSMGTLGNAISAYNAAVDGSPGNPSPALLAVRQALAAGSRQ